MVNVRTLIVRLCSVSIVQFIILIHLSIHSKHHHHFHSLIFMSSHFFSKLFTVALPDILKILHVYHRSSHVILNWSFNSSARSTKNIWFIIVWNCIQKVFKASICSDLSCKAFNLLLSLRYIVWLTNMLGWLIWTLEVTYDRLVLYMVEHSIRILPIKLCHITSP